MSFTNSHIEELLKQCKSKNHQAQMEVYSRYYKAMFNTSLRIVKDRYQAEDIMQESFLTAFTKLATLKDMTMFGSWLKRIVIHNSLQVYQNLQKHRQHPWDDVLYKIKDTSEEVEELDSYDQKVCHIMVCMNQLKDNYRISLTLHLIEGYDYEEIGQIMNISYSNCRTMISRGKENLRKKLILIEDI